MTAITARGINRMLRPICGQVDLHVTTVAAGRFEIRVPHTAARVIGIAEHLKRHLPGEVTVTSRPARRFTVYTLTLTVDRSPINSAHALTFNPTTPEGQAICHLFQRIKADVEEADGNWPGAELTDTVTRWLTDLGFDVNRSFAADRRKATSDER